jgi:hypothetical protein
MTGASHDCYLGQYKAVLSIYLPGDNGNKKGLNRPSNEGGGRLSPFVGKSR